MVKKRFEPVSTILLLSASAAIAAYVFMLQKMERQDSLPPPVVGADYIPKGASAEYAAIMNKARAACGQDVQLRAIDEYWQDATTHVVRYFLTDTPACYRQALSYWVDGGNIGGPSNESPGPDPYYDPIPLAYWNISAHQAQSISGVTQTEKPQTLLMNKSGQFYWLVDWRSNSHNTRFRIDARNGNVLEHRDYVVTI